MSGVLLRVNLVFVNLVCESVGCLLAWCVALPRRKAERPWGRVLGIAIGGLVAATVNPVLTFSL